eukprot:COSAG03_NODE_1298_length_4372_cov_1.607068_5_plen_84_part_00
MAVAEKESCSTQHTSPYTGTTVTSGTIAPMSNTQGPQACLRQSRRSMHSMRLQRLPIRTEADMSKHLGDAAEDSGLPAALCRL